MRARQNSMRTGQRGVALITVLLVFALATVIATEMLRRSQLSLRSVGNLLIMRQAYYYALGGEAYARQVLAKDVIDNRAGADTLDEAWAKTKDQAPFTIDNGTMLVEIKDLQGRFNLNSVIDNPSGLQQFVKLLQALQLNTKYADEWLDWVDKGQVRSANGAEDADYADYRTADRAESDVSALRLLHSMTAEDYAKLAPHVTVLPTKLLSPEGQWVAIATPLNVNTTDADVLRAILSEAQVSQVLARQQAGGYKSIGEVPATSATGQLAVKSNFFEVLVTVNYGGRWQRVRTVLHRDEQGELTIISRVRSPLFDDSER